MARARATEDGVHEGDARGAAAAAPRSTTPLQLVESAVAGDDLQSVVRTAAVAVSCTVAIALPAFGLCAHWPLSGAGAEAQAAVRRFASALLLDPSLQRPPELSQVVPVRLGEELVGVAAALTSEDRASETAAWLEAAAAAAAIAALLRRGSEDELQRARRAFLQELEAPERVQTDAQLVEAQRLGFDFSHGAVAVGALLQSGSFDPGELGAGWMLADLGEQRLLGLVPLGEGGDQHPVDSLLAELHEAGLPVIATAPRRVGPDLQRALHEAGVLLELLADERDRLSADEDIHRLLVGVLVRDPDELRTLRARTIAPLEEYDAAHEADLLVTLESFLAHHGSTTDTAEAMRLHRHTVGYRLARAHDISGLSPYQSAGRERLSLGLKARRILLADQRRAERIRPLDQRSGGGAG